MLRGLLKNCNLIARHWYGDYPLVVSFWVIGLLGGIGLWRMWLYFPPGLRAVHGFDPHIELSVLSKKWFATLFISIWYSVGLLRAARKDNDRRLAAGKSTRYLAIVDRLAIACLVLPVFSFFILGLADLSYWYQITSKNDPGLPDYSIRIMRNGTEAEITGGIKYGLAEEFLTALDNSPQMRVVHLDSSGGRLGEGMKLNKIIREANLITYVSGKCFSACSFAFMGGRERWLRDGAVLGFHAADKSGAYKKRKFNENNKSIEAGLARLAKEETQLLLEIGFDTGFVTRIISTPYEELWTPSIPELLDAKVVTNISKGGDFAISGYGAGDNREQVIEMLLKAYPALVSMKERLPEEYASITNIFYDGYQEGLSESEVVDSLRDKIRMVVDENRHLANDDVLVEYAKMTAEKLSFLSNKDKSLCYQHASNEPGIKRLNPDLPADFLKREAVIVERIFATVEPRFSTPEEKVNQLRDLVSEKVSNRVGFYKLSYLQSGTTDPSGYDDFCAVRIALLQEITSLPQSDAAILLREVFGKK